MDVKSISSVIGCNGGKVGEVTDGIRKDTLVRIGSSVVGQNISWVPTFWYSPELTQESWLLPKSRQEILKWCRVFYNLEPYVRSVIDMHAEFPFSRFSLIVEDQSIRDFYEEQCYNENFDIFQFLVRASLSYWKFGEVIIFSTKGKDDSGFTIWRSHVLLEPELVEVRREIFEEQTYYELIPTEELRALVRASDPVSEARKAKIPPVVIESVMAGRNIPLDPECVSHIAELTDPSATRGTPITQSLFKCLSGDTRVFLLDGTRPTIRELCERGRTDFYVYSVSPSGDIVPGKARGVVYKGRQRVVKVGLDTGISIKCTPDHLIMLRDGTYKKAEDLKLGDYLMPFYKGSKEIYVPSSGALRPIHLLECSVLCGSLGVKCIQYFREETESLAERRKVLFSIRDCKVVSLEMGEEEDVYDILQVEPYNNFAIALESETCGVFVHNCLIYQDFVRLAQMAIAMRYQFPIEVWTLGDPSKDIYPTAEELAAFRDLVNRAVQNPPFAFVFPPVVRYEAFTPYGKMFPIRDHYEYILDQILVGLGVSKNLILGEGPSIPSAFAIPLQRLITRYRKVRDMFEHWLIFRFFKPLAVANGFYTTTKDGRKKYILPKIVWQKTLDPESDRVATELLKELHRRGYVSTETLFSRFPYLNVDIEKKRIEAERGTVWDKEGRIPPKREGAPAPTPTESPLLGPLSPAPTPTLTPAPTPELTPPETGPEAL